MDDLNDFSNYATSDDYSHPPTTRIIREISGGIQVVSIPRKIMQTWKTKVLPDKWKSSSESIKEHMPAWDYTLLSDEDCLNFVKDYFPRYIDLYESCKYQIQKADIIRYMWLYHHGGMYMDADYEIIKPLDSLFYTDSELYLIKSPNFGSSYTNSFMASKARCSFWLDVLEEVNKRSKSREFWAKGKHLEVMMTTGPGMLSEVIKKTRHIYTIIPTNLINPKGICQHNTGKDDRYYLHPLEGSSWGGLDTMTMNWCYCNGNQIGWIALFLMGLMFIIFIYLMATRRQGTSTNEPIQENNLALLAFPFADYGNANNARLSGSI